MPSLFSPKIPKMTTALPSPEVPAVPETEAPEEVAKFLKKRKGREKTILAGSLEPLDIGKRTLLG